jgi:hypothetical protein
MKELVTREGRGTRAGGIRDYREGRGTWGEGIRNQGGEGNQLWVN